MGRGALPGCNFCIVGLILTGNVTSAYDPLVIPNLSRAVLSSTLPGGYEAFRVVDGRPDLLQATPGGSCSNSGIGQVFAWIRIDLLRVYSLYQVQTWYRNDRGSPQLNTERFRGYIICVTNESSLIPPNDVCFRHNSTSQTIIPIPTFNNCTRVARYVWFFKDNPPSPLDSGQIFLEICEVQILGCELNHYGENCTVCSFGCGNCDIIYGCTYCLAGHLEPDCKCPFGKFGLGCTQNCSGNCANNENCDIQTGECRNGCLPGYLGNACNQMIDVSLNPDRSSQCCFYLYAVSAILFLSLILNIFFIFRSYRNKRSKRKSHKEKNTKVNSQENTLNTEIYDKVDDNAGYQELGQLSQPFHYDKLK